MGKNLHQNKAPQSPGERKKFILMDYDNFHGASGKLESKNYLYLNARVTGKPELPQ